MNARLADTLHKTAVGDPLGADRYIDAGGPQLLESALALAAIAVGVLAGTYNGRLGVFVKARAIAEISGCGLEGPRVTLTRGLYVAGFGHVFIMLVLGRRGSPIKSPTDIKKLEGFGIAKLQIGHNRAVRGLVAAGSVQPAAALVAQKMAAARSAAHGFARTGNLETGHDGLSGLVLWHRRPV